MIGWVAWLRQVWGVDGLRDAISHASPVLADRVSALCAAEDPGSRDVRRAVLSVMRYLLRLTGRPTPNGLFAGVAAARFASVPSQRSGGNHEAVAAADAGWLAEVIGLLEGEPAVLAHLVVIANTTLMVRGGRLVVPYQPSTNSTGTRAVEVELRYSGPVRVAVAEAREPVRFDALRAKVQESFPHAAAGTVTDLLTTLVAHRVLVTNLHAPSTEPDPLGHLVRKLEPIGKVAAEYHMALNDLHDQLRQHRRRGVAARRTLRADAATSMRKLASSRRNPLAVDLRLDLEVALPETVAREAERAALLLARLTSRPGPSANWATYHRRFYQRFGTGAQVPLLEVVADSGIGWPDGYPGATPATRLPRTSRDERLLALAQTAALDGQHEVVLDEKLITELEQVPLHSLRLPSHLELCARVDSTNMRALKTGKFRLAVTAVSRSAGVVTGRFLHLLDQHDRATLTSPLLGSPNDDDVLSVQLSFPPLNPASAHVARSLQVLPTVVSLGEHREIASDSVLTAADLAVSCDSDRLYLTAPELGVHVETWGLHALNLRKHTPPLARFLIELTRAHRAEVADFDWGAAATLPFLPRLRSGRVVLSPARWRLPASDLPGLTADLETWNAALAQWRARRRLPQAVLLLDGDWRLPLDLAEDAHLVLLREHLATHPHAVLEEGPADNAAGWLDDRAHEVAFPITAQQARATERLPRPTRHRVVRPSEHGLPPGSSSLLFAKLYGDPRRQNIVLAEHLPALMAEWDEDQPQWWFLRFREGDEHYLRLRIALRNSDPAVFGEAAGRVSAWTERLRRQGLLREVVFATSYPETGRWGSGAALTAAEAVFTTDSRAVLTQLAQPQRPHHHALSAANFAAIAIAFTGSIEAGMRWLVDHVPAKPPSVVPRPVFAEAGRLADPREDFHVLRGTPGGTEIVATWAERAEALSTYRSRLCGTDAEGVDPDAALGSLLHSHFLRACGIDPEDKAVCLYLARTAALTFTARTGGAR
ncbi:lantibiotic dehydratase [Lentzea aerocolonigenes]|uniref:lantibiotic dehydratase n=1 Tax=Lentzea aerocolonigenes TaxID=68170 RepID=UPI001F3CA7C0|nr:lantibiotic dehydratase [Lentzea aerocolonigenes]